MDNINRSSMVLDLFLTVIIARGVVAACPFQAVTLFSNVYAFSPDYSVSFLALIYRTKNEAQLVQDNLLSNAATTSSNALPEQHAKNSAIHLSNS